MVDTTVVTVPPPPWTDVTVATPLVTLTVEVRVTVEDGAAGDPEEDVKETVVKGIKVENALEKVNWELVVGGLKVLVRRLEVLVGGLKVLVGGKEKGGSEKLDVRLEAGREPPGGNVGSPEPPGGNVGSPEPPGGNGGSEPPEGNVGSPEPPGGNGGSEPPGGNVGSPVVPGGKGLTVVKAGGGC
eukprot:Awhi_evm1s8476